MGCWNATCNITNLPIFQGDKVVLIPLVKVKEKTEFNVCYATDVFVPYALPLIGKYDDYGSIENIQTPEQNKKHLYDAFEYYFEEHNGGEGIAFTVAEKSEDFETFVSNVITCHEGCYIKTISPLHDNHMAEINYMMIHYDIYKEMITEIANRKIYDSTETILERVTKGINTSISKVKLQMSLYDELKKSLKDNEETTAKHSTLIDIFTRDTINNISEEVFKFGLLSPCTINWLDLSKELLNDNAEILNETINLHIFTRALDLLRKGYLCDSGAGSQSQETKMHYLVAKYIIKHIESKNKGIEKEPIFS